MDHLHFLKIKVFCFIEKLQTKTRNSLVVQWLGLWFHCRGHRFDPWSGNLRSHMPSGVAKKKIFFKYKGKPQSGRNYSQNVVLTEDLCLEYISISWKYVLFCLNFTMIMSYYYEYSNLIMTTFHIPITISINQSTNKKMRMKSPTL